MLCGLRTPSWAYWNSTSFQNDFISLENYRENNQPRIRILHRHFARWATKLSNCLLCLPPPPAQNVHVWVMPECRQHISSAEREGYRIGGSETGTEQWQTASSCFQESGAGRSPLFNKIKPGPGKRLTYAQPEKGAGEIERDGERKRESEREREGGGERDSERRPTTAWY